jgi:hypothetical protein
MSEAETDSTLAPSPPGSPTHPREPMMLAVFDGYMRQADDHLTSVTKLGGRPAFLNDMKSTIAKQVLGRAQCKRCNGALFLLAQCYCPLRDGFNRMMYVFACNKARCCEYPAESWCAFSVQRDEEDPAVLAEDEEDFQRLDEPEKLTKLAFPSVATFVEEEPDKETIVQTDVEKEMQRMAEVNANTDQNIKETDLEELEQNVDLKDKATDEYYEKFRSRVARMPSQVLRYQVNGMPIFMNPDKTIDVSIPPCTACGGPCSMELQVMPTALYYLKAAQCAPEGGSDGLDFATATVYTCARRCRAAARGVVVREEHIFVEPPPSAADEKSAREGRMSLRETVTGSADAQGPTAAGATVGVDDNGADER